MTWIRTIASPNSLADEQIHRLLAPDCRRRIVRTGVIALARQRCLAARRLESRKNADVTAKTLSPAYRSLEITRRRQTYCPGVTDQVISTARPTCGGDTARVVGDKPNDSSRGRNQMSCQSGQVPEARAGVERDPEVAAGQLVPRPGTSIPEAVTSVSIPPPASAPEAATPASTPSTEKVRQKPAIGRVANRFILHPLWSTLGAIIGVIGIAVSIIQLWDSSDAGYIPAELEVSILTVDSPEEIEGVVIYPDNSQQSINLTASPVDITLKNNGDRPSLITEANAEVLFHSQLQDCTAGVGSPRQGRLSAAYSIKLPTAENKATGELATTSTSMRFEVKPGSVDRMRLTLGPDKQAYATNYPLAMAVHITLVHDGSETLDVGTVAFATTGESVQTQIRDGENPDCAAANLEILDNLYKIQAYRAPDLDRMRKRFQQLAHG